MSQYDRSDEDIGNIVCLEHVNIRVPDQQLATTFYVVGLGLTRDPYIMTGTNNMWMNAGRAQFHLPSGNPQVLRGHTGLIIEGREALLTRLAGIRAALEGSKFSFTEHSDYVETVCPWGNIIRCYEPSEKFGSVRLGMPYVSLNVPTGSTPAIARFYNEVIGTKATIGENGGSAIASASVGDGQTLVFHETDEPQPEFDGHHIAVYLANFSGPYNKLLERRLITEESDQHQYRFIDIIDPDSGAPVFKLEHEVRSMRHPLYARPLINRNPAMNNRNYQPGGLQEATWVADSAAG
jgi:catechol 2,3-dioxygenase-like lactoylglutathione lyase family enzyme